MLALRPMNETTTYFHKPGSVAVGKNKGEGSILFTNTFFFALRSKNSGEKIGRHFGLIGILIGRAVDFRRAKASPPQYLEHPELANLDAHTLKLLRSTELLCFMPLNAGFTVTEKFSGFVFAAPECQTVVFKAIFSKGSVRKYLKERGIPVVK
jgi:hypothetical protein